MIRPLRIRHRRIFTLLGVLLPVAFGFGIAARKPVPQMDALPTALHAATPRFNTLLWEQPDLFTNAPVTVRLLRGAERLAVTCSAPDSFVKPDLLVYWSTDRSRAGNTLPDDATLLGAFAASVLPLPADSAGRSGVLVLFSLADQEIVAISRPIHFNDSTP
jgi:hypothetical protein